MRAAILTLLVSFVMNIRAAEATLPTNFLVGIGGFLGASYRVELIQGSNAVRYLSNPQTFTSLEGTKEESLDIPSERWQVFRKSLDEAKVWTWKRKYEDKRVADGTQWRVRIEWNGRKADSFGNNAYPDKKQFAVFKAAVSELLAGKKFE